MEFNDNRGILNNFSIKIIATLCMLIDHVGFVLLNNNIYCRAIGRIAFPLFCFMIVEGFFHTRSHANYLIRLSVFALISEIPFDLAFFHKPFDWSHQNVFFTLAFGLITIFCLEEANNRKWFYGPAIGFITLAQMIHCDYGAGGVLLICALYKAKDNPAIRFILSALILYVFFCLSGQKYSYVELFGLISFIPITLYNEKRGPETKLLFYWFYPVHLLLIFALYTLIK